MNKLERPREIIEYCLKPLALATDTDAYQDMSAGENPYGDGNAAKRIVEAIGRWHQKKTPLLDPEREFKLPARPHPRRRRTDRTAEAEAMVPEEAEV